MLRIRYIEVSSFAHSTINAQLTGGGIGTTGIATSIALNAQHGGPFSATYDRERGRLCPAHYGFAKMCPGSVSTGAARLLIGLLVLSSSGLFQVLAQPPEALNYPNVITFGAFTGTICYSNSVAVKTLTPITTRTFTFVPATALTYVICYNNLALHPFEVQLVGGGLGATTQTSIVLTSATGKLFANCDAYCA
uniref:Uncharacterized protein n=1 Tax=Anopheles maculatus TaxID=74869 RepID=A0A182SRZ3_9DIPT